MRKLIITISILLLIGAVAATYSGFVLSVLWGWFFVPTFGLPKLSVPAAIGISMTVSYLTKDPIENQDQEFSDKMFSVFLYPTFALVAGWVIQLFL